MWRASSQNKAMWGGGFVFHPVCTVWCHGYQWCVVFSDRQTSGWRVQWRTNVRLTCSMTDRRQADVFSDVQTSGWREQDVRNVHAWSATRALASAWKVLLSSVFRQTCPLWVKQGHGAGLGQNVHVASSFVIFILLLILHNQRVRANTNSEVDNTLLPTFMPLRTIHGNKTN